MQAGLRRVGERRPLASTAAGPTHSPSRWCLRPERVRSTRDPTRLAPSFSIEQHDQYQDKHAAEHECSRRILNRLLAVRPPGCRPAAFQSGDPLAKVCDLGAELPDFVALAFRPGVHVATFRPGVSTAVIILRFAPFLQALQLPAIVLRSRPSGRLRRTMTALRSPARAVASGKRSGRSGSSGCSPDAGM